MGGGEVGEVAGEVGAGALVKVLEVGEQAGGVEVAGAVLAVDGGLDCCGVDRDGVGGAVGGPLLGEGEPGAGAAAVLLRGGPGGVNGEPVEPIARAPDRRTAPLPPAIAVPGTASRGLAPPTAPDLRTLIHKIVRAVEDPDHLTDRWLAEFITKIKGRWNWDSDRRLRVPADDGQGGLRTCVRGPAVGNVDPQEEVRCGWLLGELVADPRGVLLVFGDRGFQLADAGGDVAVEVGADVVVSRLSTWRWRRRIRSAI